MNDKRRTDWLASLNGDGRLGQALLAAQLLLLLPALGGVRVRELLQYERSALADGELWRLLTAHLVHYSWRHLLLNMAGLAVLWALFAREWSPGRWLLIAVVAALAIDAGLWFRAPEVAWYLGLSGVLHGLWAAGALAQLQRRQGFATLPLLLLVSKLAYEQLRGGSLVMGDMPVVTGAHLYGAAGGLICGWVLARWAKPL
jgi:rhomboid family GlyGly-CTERM serine protease